MSRTILKNGVPYIAAEYVIMANAIARRWQDRYRQAIAGREMMDQDWWIAGGTFADAIEEERKVCHCQESTDSTV